MTTTSISERWRNRRPQEQWSNWSDLPRDIVEDIFGRLDWIGRFRLRAVCKAWSVLNPLHGHVNLPWAMEFYQHDFECRLFDPLSGEYVVRRTTDEASFLCDGRQSTPLASAYGWVLFRRHLSFTHSLILYSPFTGEIIPLPRIGLPEDFKAAFSLNETSPECVVFLCWIGGSKIHVKLCFLGDSSWKSFEFDAPNYNELFAVDVTYANGSFYCLLRKGELGAFNVDDKSWTILVQRPWPGADYYRYRDAKLIASDNGDLLRLWNPFDSKLFKFDSSEMRWVNDNDLDNQILFIGCTGFIFSIPTPGKLRQLHDHLRVRTYACTFCCSSSTSPICVMNKMCTMGWIANRKDGLPSCAQSQLYINYVMATQHGTCWIQLPLGGIWRANDLVHRPV